MPPPRKTNSSEKCKPEPTRSNRRASRPPNLKASDVASKSIRLWLAKNWAQTCESLWVRAIFEFKKNRKNTSEISEGLSSRQIAHRQGGSQKECAPIWSCWATVISSKGRLSSWQLYQRVSKECKPTPGCSTRTIFCSPTSTTSNACYLLKTVLKTWACMPSLDSPQIARSTLLNYRMSLRTISVYCSITLCRPVLCHPNS